jgi:hypothetical protein
MMLNAPLRVQCNIYLDGSACGHYRAVVAEALVAAPVIVTKN